MDAKSIKVITIWYKLDENGDKKFNHFDDGWNLHLYPMPRQESFVNQKAWAKMNWFPVLGYLDGIEVKKIYNSVDNGEE